MMRLRASFIACLLCAGSAASQGASLYDEAKFQSLTAVRRAASAGDILTVLIYETASASATADTSTEKTGGLGIALSASSGSGNNTRTDSVGAKGSLNEDFSGKGRIQRSGRLVAQLSVLVREVYPNGDLAVAGQQTILVNGEKQQIVLSGRVRPVDIGETNSVISSRLADAQITFIGDGILGEKQRPGLISRVLSWLGLL